MGTAPAPDRDVVAAVDRDEVVAAVDRDQVVATVDRDQVVAMLATYGDRAPAEVGERIDSLELAWLVHQVEQRYGGALDLDDDDLVRMSTVSGAVEVLRAVMTRAADG